MDIEEKIQKIASSTPCVIDDTLLKCSKNLLDKDLSKSPFFKIQNFNDCFVLSTGKEIQAHQGIIGINPLTDRIYHGYDGYIDRLEYDSDVDDEVNQLLPEERIEIAEYTINLWQEYIKKIKEAK
jgi:hypothetical protein